MLYRNKKKKDINAGKYIAPGGHMEPGETPRECAMREVLEETGLTLSDCTLRGVVHFFSPDDEEDMFIFTATDFDGELIECNEGELKWIEKDSIMDLNLWDGDREFLKLLLDDSRFFVMTLRYNAYGQLIMKREPMMLMIDNAVDRIAAYLDPSVRKALVVTGRHSAKSTGALDDIDTVLGQRLGVEYEVFDQVEENPSVETIMAAAEMGKAFGADAVIGIGGGSPMDAAKAIALMLKNPDKGADYLYEAGNPCDHLPVICIPTTCGTGSEATAVSVLSRPDIKEKGSIPYRIWPILGLMDHKYLKKAPVSVIRNTAVDALSHLMESYINTKASDLSRAYVMEGLRIWAGSKDALCGDREMTDTDYKNLLLASTIAGMAISSTGTSIPHALSYTLTIEAGFPHGAAVGYFLAGYMREAGEEGKKLLHAVGCEDAGELDRFINRVCSFAPVSEEILTKAINKLMKKHERLAICPYQVDEEMLGAMATSEV